MKITDEMIKKFNEYLSQQGSFLMIERAEGRNGVIDVVIQRDPFIKKDNLVYPTEAFYLVLNRFFAEYDIIPSWNNTRTTFWSL